MSVGSTPTAPGSTPGPDDSPALRRALTVLRRGWTAITASALLGLATAAALWWLMTPMYEAETRLFVSARAASSISDLETGSSYSQKVVGDVAQLAASPAVLGPVVDRLDLPDTAAEAAERVEAVSPNDSAILEITVRDQLPGRAAETADAVAAVLAEQTEQIFPTTDGGDQPVTFTPVEEATVPEDPVSPRPLLYGAAGLLVGASLGVAGVTLRSLLDTRIRDEEDLEGISDAPVLGRIGRSGRRELRTLLADPDAPGMVPEALRGLRTNLQFLGVDRQQRTFTITSALPGEGKTTLAVNLAASLRHAGHRVLLVDADLRRPGVADRLGLEGAVGLADVLARRVAVDDVIQPWGPEELAVLPAGTVPPNAHELLSSQSMEQLMHALEQSYDIVLVDTPPLLAVADAAMLAGRSSGALLAVGMSMVRRPQLRRALDTLEHVGAPLLGLVTTKVPMDRHSREHYGYIPYGTRRSDARD